MKTANIIAFLIFAHLFAPHMPALANIHQLSDAEEESQKLRASLKDSVYIGGSADTPAHREILHIKDGKAGLYIMNGRGKFNIPRVYHAIHVNFIKNTMTLGEDEHASTFDIQKISEGKITEMPRCSMSFMRASKEELKSYLDSIRQPEIMNYINSPQTNVAAKERKYQAEIEDEETLKQISKIRNCHSSQAPYTLCIACIKTKDGKIESVSHKIIPRQGDDAARALPEYSDNDQTAIAIDCDFKDIKCKAQISAPKNKDFETIIFKSPDWGDKSLDIGCERVEIVLFTVGGVIVL